MCCGETAAVTNITCSSKQIQRTEPVLKSLLTLHAIPCSKKSTADSTFDHLYRDWCHAAAEEPVSILSGEQLG